MSTGLKLIAIYDEKSHAWKATDHNLSQEEVEDAVEVLQLQEVTNVVLSQRARHTVEDAETCAACRARIRLQPKPEPAEAADGENQTPPASQPEGDEPNGEQSQARDPLQRDE